MSAQETPCIIPNMLWEELLPISARINDARKLEIGGCDAEALAEEFGTPLYVFDIATLRALAEEATGTLNSLWKDSTVLYATKAYFSPFLADLYKGLGLGLDVTSEAEIEIARRVEFPREKIYLHGNNKTPAEIRAALTAGIEHLVVDNLDEIGLIARLANEISAKPVIGGEVGAGQGIIPRLLIRLSPNIDAHTHRYLTTGVADSKFGLGIANGAAAHALQEIQRYPNLRLVGLHLHIGSQVFETERMSEALGVALELAVAWWTRYGFSLKELNLGGGWGVAYNESQNSLDIGQVLNSLTDTLREGLTSNALDENVKLVVEPGRALIARAAVALYRVGPIKESGGGRTYAAVDGGMGDNIRPALYGSRYSAFVANKMDAPATREYAIVGRYCEQGDVLIESARLPELQQRDLLAIPTAGAYQIPMASNYNLIPRPAVVVVGDNRVKVIRRRETIEDMIACDILTSFESRPN